MCKQYRASKENCSYTNIAIPHPPPPPKKITGQLQSERKWRKFGPDFHFILGGERNHLNLLTFPNGKITTPKRDETGKAPAGSRSWQPKAGFLSLACVWLTLSQAHAANALPFYPHIQVNDENGFGFTEDFFVTEESSETEGLKLPAEVKEGELQHRAGCEIQKS